MIKAKSEKAAVNRFLQDIKQVIINPQATYETWVLVPREKNITSLATLGFTFSDVKNTILALSVCNYCDGPMSDPEVRGDCWIFGKIISEYEVYIKLKLASIAQIRKVRIISFHIAEDSLCYPFPE